MFKQKEYFGVFILTCLLNFTFFASSSSLGLIPPYLSSLGASKTYIGFFMNLSSLVVVIFVVIFGKYLHYIKRKKAFFISSIISIITFILMFIFNNDLHLLLFLRALNVIQFAFCFSMHVSIIFDITLKEKRASSLAIFGLSGILSNPVGSFLSEVISKNFGHKYLFLLSLCFVLIYFFLLIFLKEPHLEFHKTQSKSFFDILKRKEILNIIVFAIVFGGVFSIYSSFIPNFTKERLNVALLSAYFIPFASITVIIRLFLSQLLDRINSRLLILIAYSSVLLSVILILFMNSVIILVLVGIFYGIGHSILYPTVSTMFVNLGKAEEKEILNSSFVALHTFGSVFMATFLGLIGDIFGITSIFVTLLLIALLTFTYSIIYYKKTKN